jgi:hypothetical protein
LKKIFYLLFLILATGLILPTPALALTETISSFQIGNNKYNYNGQQYEMDAAPFILEGRTYISVRYLANSIGISNENIKWDDASSTVTLIQGNTKVELIVNKPEIYVNGDCQAIDVAPVIKYERICLPARYIAEAFKYSVDWNQDEALLSINKDHLDWKAKQYSDTGKHFSLYYPSNWTISKENESIASTLYIVSPPESDNDDFLENIIVIQMKDPEIKSATLDQMVDLIVKNSLSSQAGSEVYKSENMIIDGLPAKYIEAKFNDGKVNLYINQIIVKIQDECFFASISVKNTNLYDEVKYTLIHSFIILDEARKVLPAQVAEYEGDWSARDSEGLIHPDGKGKLTYINGDEYAGDIKNGQKHGYGCYTWSNQELYQGEWKNDLKDGEGFLVYFDPKKYLQTKFGIWQNDQFIRETEYQYKLSPIDIKVGP